MYTTRNEKHQRETPHEERTHQKAQYLPTQDKAEHTPREASNQRMTAQEEEENNEKKGSHHGSNIRNRKYTPGEARKCDGIHGLNGKTETTNNNAREQDRNTKKI